ncbi:hypothetical protein E3Q24_01422 [Wallemia mellicola]|uniref:Cyclin-like protein n=1 Tax=Wallemia mellicola TaxID=1708541 RepID=A0AB74KGG2_9BASI|nr:hypothetical protein E3Q24_01422 [Wallemia mellicola]TIC24360.1 cyclin-like protein [Wallemia mellicola]TIC68926.1 cyclin-like protein [Wallemia mellicola]
MAFRGSPQGYNRQPAGVYYQRNSPNYKNSGYTQDYHRPQGYNQVNGPRNNRARQYNNGRQQNQFRRPNYHPYANDNYTAPPIQRHRPDPEAIQKEKERRDDLIAIEKERRLLSSRTNPHIKHFEPYFTQFEAETLSRRQHGKMSDRQANEIKRFATAFVEKLGHQLGFPRRTIATAQMLYIRFHLFYPLKDFNPHDVAVVATFVSAKMHDTLKKLHQVVAVSMHIRFPEKFKNPSVDDNLFEAEKKRLLPIERLLLESISFSFKLKRPFDILVKLCRLFKVSKEFSKCCWKVLSDTHRTLAPLLHSPHSLALSSIYLTSILLQYDHQHLETSRTLLSKFESYDTSWLSEYGTGIDSLDCLTSYTAVLHFVLDLFIDENELQHSNSNITFPDFLQTKIRLRENAERRENRPDVQMKPSRGYQDASTTGRSYILEQKDLQVTPEQSTRYLFE